MKNEKIKTIKEKVKPIILKTLKYIILGTSIVVSFMLGRLIESYSKEREVKTNIIRFNKEDISIAIDEGNNLIVIDNDSGDYIIYQDSIGYSIFKVYANNIWKQGD
jgi:hypothetical protein